MKQMEMMEEGSYDEYEEGDYEDNPSEDGEYEDDQYEDGEYEETQYEGEDFEDALEPENNESELQEENE